MTDRQLLDAEKIYDILSRQSFARFYGEVNADTDNTPFGNHLRGDVDCLTKSEILQKIVDLFRL